MAKKKGGFQKAAQKAKVMAKKYSSRGGRLMSMFKTAFAVSAAALVGGVALNVANSAREKPAEGMTAGVFTFGAGALLAFALGLFKGTRQYVTPVLAGATAVGALSAFNGPIARGSNNIANALLGRKGKDDAAMAEKRIADKERSVIMGPQAMATGVAQSQAQKQVRVSKGEQLIGLASNIANLGASIASAAKGGTGGMGGGIGGMARAGVGAAAGDDDMDGSEGLDDYSVGSGDMDGSEGLDDFAIVGSARMDD